jgi:hypothetical protein
VGACRVGLGGFGLVSVLPPAAGASLWRLRTIEPSENSLRWLGACLVVWLLVSEWCREWLRWFHSILVLFSDGNGCWFSGEIGMAGAEGERFGEGLEACVVGMEDEKFDAGLLEEIEFFRACKAMFAIIRGDFGGTSGGLSLMGDHPPIADVVGIACGGSCWIRSACLVELSNERGLSGIADWGITE